MQQPKTNPLCTEIRWTRSARRFQCFNHTPLLEPTIATKREYHCRKRCLWHKYSKIYRLFQCLFWNASSSANQIPESNIPCIARISPVVCLLASLHTNIADCNSVILAWRFRAILGGEIGFGMSVLNFLAMSLSIFSVGPSVLSATFQIISSDFLESMVQQITEPTYAMIENVYKMNTMATKSCHGARTILPVNYLQNFLRKPV